MVTSYYTFQCNCTEQLAINIWKLRYKVDISKKDVFMKIREANILSLDHIMVCSLK